MKIYVKSSRYNSEPSSLSKFEGFDKQKYFKLYSSLFHTITDGMNADLKNNIKKAFELVGGKCGIEYASDRYIKFDGRVYPDYTVGGSISLEYLEGDARRLAEDLTMASFRTTEGKDVPCNTYEFVDWMLSSDVTSSKDIKATKLLKIKRRSGNIDEYVYKREDGQGSVYEPAGPDDWFHSYIVTPEGKLLSWTTQGQYYPSNNEFWIEDIDTSTDIKASEDSNIKYIQSEWQFSPSDYDYSLPLPKHIGFCGCGGRSWVSLDSDNLDTWGSCEEAVEDAKQNYKPGSHIYIYKIDMDTREILDYCDEVKI